MSQKSPTFLTAPLDVPPGSLPPRFSWLKRTAALTLALALFVFLSRAAWIRHSQARLNAELDRWRQDGLSLAPPDPGPPVPDDQNAAVALRRAGALVHFSREFDALDGSQLFGKRHWSDSTRAMVERAVAANRPAVEAARASRGLPAARWEVMTLQQIIVHPSGKPDVHYFDYHDLRDLATAIDLDGRLAQVKGDDAALLDDVLALDFLGRTAARDPTGISFVVGPLLHGRGTALIDAAVHDLRVGDPAVRDRAKKVVFAFFDDAPFDTAAVAAIVRSAGFDLENLRTDLPAGAYRPFSNDSAIIALSRLEVMAWRFLKPVRLRNAADILASLRADVHSGRELSYPASRAGAGRAVAVPRVGLVTVDPLLRDVSANYSGFEQYESRRFGRQIAARFAAVQLAARLYREDHGGDFPPALAELVPAYLPALPVDCFDPAGRPIRYVPTGGKPFVYSLGVSGIDTTASAARPGPSRHMDWKGNYICFLDP